jgi:hypothetical protein
MQPLGTEHPEEPRPSFRWKQRGIGGVWGFVGFMLSPLSWWNDLFVNVPLAIAFAWTVSFFYPPAFKVSLVVGYWLTNVLGLYLLHRGARQLWTAATPAWLGRECVKDMAVALGYTALILLLIECRVLEPLPAYFGTK